MSNKFRVGILGATGMVGQRFIQLLEDHPQFKITALAASDRSQGKPYAEACTWRLPGELPSFARKLVVQAPEPPLDCDLVFSSLPGDIARETEGNFAASGYPVISNSSAYRLDGDVPLLIPEVNPNHLGLLDVQRVNRKDSKGFIVTNPNCSTIMLALVLAPLHARFGVTSVIATTMQALSKLARTIGIEDLRDALSTFSALPQELRLHSAPERPIIVRNEPDRPQPRLDRDAGFGMSVSVGRLMRDSVLDYRLIMLSHNTIRGAAGAAILNAELLIAMKLLK